MSSRARACCNATAPATALANVAASHNASYRHYTYALCVPSRITHTAMLHTSYAAGSLAAAVLGCTPTSLFSASLGKPLCVQPNDAPKPKPALLTPAALLVLDALTAPQGSMCAPPRVNINQSTRLLAPSYCIAASKTRRRRRRGDGGDGEVPDDDDGGSFGGGDDGFNGGGGGDRFWWSNQGPLGGGNPGGHIFILWQTLCVLCFLQTMQYTVAAVLNRERPLVCEAGSGKDGSLLVMC